MLEKSESYQLECGMFSLDMDIESNFQTFAIYLFYIVHSGDSGRICTCIFSYKKYPNQDYHLAKHIFLYFFIYYRMVIYDNNLNFHFKCLKPNYLESPWSRVTKYWFSWIFSIFSVLLAYQMVLYLFGGYSFTIIHLGGL